MSGGAGTSPTKLAALVAPGDRIGYEGVWRTVKATTTDIGAMGGLFVRVTWEEGGYGAVPGRGRAGDATGQGLRCVRPKREGALERTPSPPHAKVERGTGQTPRPSGPALFR